MRRLLWSLLALGWSNALALPETALMAEALMTFDLDDQSEAGPVASQGGDLICLSAGCVKAAAALLENIDPSQDPCQDFYQFACGTYLKETVIPSHMKKKGRFNTLGTKLKERLKTLFEADPEEDEPAVFASARKLYSSCMDQDRIEKSGRALILKRVEELGGWPVLEGQEWNMDAFTWQKLVETAQRMGLHAEVLLHTKISVSSKDSTKYMLKVDQPKPGLARKYLINGFEDADVQAYFRYMIGTAVYLGADEELARNELKEALKFELKLSEISLSKEARRNETLITNHMSIDNASKLYPDYDWLDHLNNILDSKDISLNKEEIINLAVPEYFKALGSLLPNTEKRSVANYMVWRYVKYMMTFTDKEGLDIKLAYDSILSGKQSKSPRWETCVKSTAQTEFKPTTLYHEQGSLTNAVGSMFARQYFPIENKAVADEMVTTVREEFKLMLNELDWMDEKTRNKAHEKIDLMKSFIAYENEILNNTILDSYYAGLSLDSTNYLENMLSVKRFINKHYTDNFRAPVDPYSWNRHSGAAIVNAFYEPSENSMNFPAGFIDGVFFQADRPAYMNYGALGVVIGHEITHGFDDQGRLFDAFGNLVNWWEKETKEKYLEKAQCIIDQYGNYTVDVKGETINLNGVTTQGENIADHGGVKESIRAYDRLIARTGLEPRLPGLPYSQNQLFWLSGGAMWCQVSRPEALKEYILTDPHSPARFRINGPFSNMVEFARDWNCPTGSPMNPEKKCRVW